MKLQLKTLNNPQFSMALMKLAQQDKWNDFKAAYNVGKIVRRIDREMNVARETHQKMLEVYGERDDKGNFVMEGEGPTAQVKVQADKEKEYKEKLDSFLAGEVEIDCAPVALDAMSECNLTPLELNSLEPIFVVSADK